MYSVVRTPYSVLCVLRTSIPIDGLRIPTKKVRSTDINSVVVVDAESILVGRVTKECKHVCTHIGLVSQAARPAIQNGSTINSTQNL